MLLYYALPWLCYLLLISMQRLYGDIEEYKQQSRPTGKYGNYKVLCTVGEQPICMLGPHYYVFICAFLTIAFLLTLMYVKSFEHFNQFWKVTVLIGILMTTGSYLMIGLSNPGIIPIVEPFVEDEDIGYQPHYCRFCKKNKPAGARHCTECGICIRGHDHHCVWIGKCAGEGNIYRFYFFVLSLFSTFIVFFIASISSTPLKSTGY